MSKKEKTALNSRRGKTGGEALIEGVMMKSAKRYAVSVRLPDGSIKTKVEDCHPAKEKHKWMGFPLIRGVVGFVESMILSYRCLGYSAEALGLDEAEPESRFEKWLDRKFGNKLTGVVMAFSMVLGIALAIGLFAVLPGLAGHGINYLFGGGLTWQLSIIEGLMKIAIFTLYLWLVSLTPDIKRTFEYHGAEHKTIACYEAGDELIPANVKKHTRFHPRCGTAFLFVMMAISILVFTLIYLIPGFDTDNTLLRILIRLPVLPLLFGLGYEFIRYAGTHDNVLIRALSQPGLWMQRLTTKEPDESEIEVAIMSLKLSLLEEFPEAEEEARAAMHTKESEADGKNAEDSAEQEKEKEQDSVAPTDGEV